jgi:hypothetical protein
MSVSNLAIVFGPTLSSQTQNGQIDPMLQNKVRPLLCAARLDAD